MITRILLFFFLTTIVFSSYSQEDKILEASKNFFQSYQQKDSIQLNKLFITRQGFWDYLNHSYEIGDLNDTMVVRSAVNYIRLKQLWWSDVLLSHKKAAELYKIHWQEIKNTEYNIKYEERTNTGFMFQSYTVTITFAYKKNTYTMLLDGFVMAGNQPCILANGLSLRKY